MFEVLYRVSLPAPKHRRGKQQDDDPIVTRACVGGLNQFILLLQYCIQLLQYKNAPDRSTTRTTTRFPSQHPPTAAAASPRSGIRAGVMGLCSGGWGDGWFRFARMGF